MPRIKASPKKCVKTQNSNQSSNTWVFLLKGEALDNPDGAGQGGATTDVVQLRHPQTGAGASFLFSPGDGIVQEVLTFSENKRSWFIEDNVKSEGKMHLSTPIDPIFLVLPYLRKTNMCVPLDQMLKDDEFPETARLFNSLGFKHLNQVADRKGDEELNAYKYNEEKTLAWLQRKTERVAEILRQKGVHVGSGAVSSTFLKTAKQQQADADSNEAYLKYAHGIVSEYLSDDLSAKLLKYMGISGPAVQVPSPPVSSSPGVEGGLGGGQGGGKRKAAPPSHQQHLSSLLPPHQLLPTHQEKKPRQEETDSSLDDHFKNGVLDLTKPEKATKPNPLTAKEKARAKSASGSKNIATFFKKK
ncbi:ribonuclease H2 subunit B [Ischnura elegans]|uniref:ribonuclease H2 subunit B n=1 Tax=Ischnura elegans TaxID=197161 RepID=UPI001ED894BB|nr:ribonuclease H2 subunit B [Ischnura elegans]